MDQTEHPFASAHEEEVGEQSLPDELRRLADDARSLAEAEFAYQKSRATYAGKQVAIIAVLGVVAAVFLFFALMALVVGTVIALASALGAWGSMAVVTGVLVAIAIGCVIVAILRWKSMMAVIAGD